ncbi:DUF5998 family protein [Zhihengliuella salsuginis]|uniref:Cell wall biosynthesis glycosyltransferase n=1 Tax=Zhihengliuella salsuginis TaxID=578222 RepID=A0ABQ3GCU2_9MICC|nr:DUF5998 family protein [Zhihengliuella salsuginis]GHD01161.1 hypothetical protein GCM10008096_04960 [Zhihengliuella salsuginis]
MFSRPQNPSDSHDALPALRQSLSRAAFYPQLVEDVVVDALDSDVPVDHFIHLETHFDHDEVHRHVTALVLTSDVLVIVHVDDQQLDEQGDHVVAQASTETVPVARIGSVLLSSVYHQPQEYKSGDPVREMTLAIAWSGGQRLDLMPAGCSDPQCDADHGYTGTVAREDLVLRISAEADGPTAVEDARRFARTLRKINTAAALGRRA